MLPVVFSASDGFIAPDVYIPRGCFGSTFSRFKIGNDAYVRPVSPPNLTVSLETSVVNYDFPYLVTGDFNIHNPAVDFFIALSSNEERESAPFFA